VRSDAGFAVVLENVRLRQVQPVRSAAEEERRHSLIKKYGEAAVEDACATALDIGVQECRFVRRYLERRPHPHMFLRQIDPLIRELTEYRDFINLKIIHATAFTSCGTFGPEVHHGAAEFSDFGLSRRTT